VLIKVWDKSPDLFVREDSEVMKLFHKIEQNWQAGDPLEYCTAVKTLPQR
jgi:hypothetical protein